MVVELLQCCHGDVIFSSRGAVVLSFQLRCNVGGGGGLKERLVGWGVGGGQGALDYTLIRGFFEGEATMR